MHILRDKFKDLPLIYTDVLKAVFWQSHKLPCHSFMNNAHGSAGDTPKMCLSHWPFTGRSKGCSGSCNM